MYNMWIISVDKHEIARKKSQGSLFDFILQEVQQHVEKENKEERGSKLRRMVPVMNSAPFGTPIDVDAPFGNEAISVAAATQVRLVHYHYSLIDSLLLTNLHPCCNK